MTAALLAFATPAVLVALLRAAYRAQAGRAGATTTPSSPERIGGGS